MYSAAYNAPTGGGLALGATLTSGTPAAAMVSQPGALPPGSQDLALIKVLANITSGATPGAYVIKLFQGNGLAGTQVGPAAGYTVLAPTSGAFIAYCTFFDTSGYLGGQYTVSITAAGSNGTFNFGSIEVMVPALGSDD